MADNILCTGCNKDVSIKKIKENFNLCYLCSCDLSNNEEVMKFKDASIKQKKIENKKSYK